MTTFNYFFTIDCPEEISRKGGMVELFSYGTAYVNDHSDGCAGHGRYKVPVEIMPDIENQEEYCNFDWDEYLIGFDYYKDNDPQGPQGELVEVWLGASEVQ